MKQGSPANPSSFPRARESRRPRRSRSLNLSAPTMGPDLRPRIVALDTRFRGYDKLLHKINILPVCFVSESGCSENEALFTTAALSERGYIFAAAQRGRSIRTARRHQHGVRAI